MDELHDRFRRLDRIATPDLWNEAVGRAAELDTTPRRGFNPMMAFVAASLLMAALVGTIAVGGWVNRPEADPLSVVYSNGMIAAVDSCGQVVAIDIDTSTVTDLVAAPADVECGEVAANDMAWSSDGRWLAYSTSGVERPEVWVYDANRRASELLHSCEYCTDLDISPDGSLVTYVDWSDGVGTELIVARTDGGTTHRVPFLGAPGEPAFSPDGKLIAIPLTGGTSGVHVLDVSSLAEAAIPTMSLLYGPVASRNVSWSPDGQWLAFDKIANGDSSEIWAIRSNGTDARPLASGPGPAPAGPKNPAWSADSTTVAYISTPNDAQANAWRFELWTATLDGNADRIYRAECCLSNHAKPEWSPDGEWIAFGIESAEDASGSGLFLVRPDGSDLHRLTAFAQASAWQSLIEEP
jgi:Tol biopolymer transport system component